MDSQEEAIGLANDSEFGLGASVWTMNRAEGERIARRLEAGMVWVNDHMYSHGACPCAWGGVKDSGLGRSHSKFGFYECVNMKLRGLGAVAHARLLVAPLRRVARPRACTPPRKLLYGRDADKPQALRDGLGPLAAAHPQVAARRAEALATPAAHGNARRWVRWRPSDVVGTRGLRARLGGTAAIVVVLCGLALAGPASADHAENLTLGEPMPPVPVSARPGAVRLLLSSRSPSPRWEA